MISTPSPKTLIYPHRKSLSLKIFLFLLAAGFVGPSLTWSESLPLDETLRQEISIAKKTRKREEAWDKEKSRLEATLAQLQTRRDRLRLKADALIWANNKRAQEVSVLTRNIAAAKELTEKLTPVVNSEFKSIDKVVENGLPFLSQERQERLGKLKEWMGAPSSMQPAKLERLLEFLTIEAEYGHTCEVYQQTIALDGKETTVDILKIGRMALFYLTLDQENCGTYDPMANTFTPLSGHMVSKVKKATALARREQSAELVSLPIGRIELP